VIGGCAVRRYTLALPALPASTAMRLLAALLSLALPLSALAQSPPRAQDEHSWAEPDKVRIRHLALDLRVDFERRELRGHVDLALDWRDPKARELVLDTRDLRIDRVLAKSGDSGWHRADFALDEADPIFGSKLSISLRRQHEVVRIRYRTSPSASGLQWLEPAMTAGGQHPFLFSQSQAIHARSWVPLQDTPGVRFTYSARIRTAPQLMALMSADNDPAAMRNGSYLFRMPQPIPSYLLAIAVGDLAFAPISDRAGIWAEPATLDGAVAEFADTERMIEVTESLYGPYRWGRYDLLILPPSFPFGGMENPRLSFITPTVIVGDRSLTGLIAHELAHSWSGNLVTNASWKDMWLNEGFTSYVENRIVEAVYGVERAEMEQALSQRQLQDELAELEPAMQALLLPPTPGRDPDDALTAVAYDKGAWFLHFLEQRFGRERFDAWLRGYFNRHAFRSITSEDFLADLREHLLPTRPKAISEEELDEWLNGAGVPSFARPTRSVRFEAVDAALAQWQEGTRGAAGLRTAQWSTQEWVRFLEGLPSTLPAERMSELDAAFRFTGTANPEIAQRWYPLSIRSGYFEARVAIADFLKRIGRRKLILPIYSALAASPEDLGFARKVFEEARPGYHPITVASVEAILAKAEAEANPERIEQP
jgi:leukotriene-A4 hydrolase